MYHSASWSSLANAPPPASLLAEFSDANDAVAICEVNACITSRGNAVGRNMTSKAIADLPAIVATQTADPGRPAAPSGSRNVPRGSSAKTAFLAPKRREDDSLKRFLSVWQVEGWIPALEDLWAGNAPSSVKMVAKSVLNLHHYLTISLYGSLLPTLSEEEMTAKFNATRSWFESPVRCLAWHPHTFKVAVAVRDDSIQIYTASSGSSSCGPSVSALFSQQLSPGCYAGGGGKPSSAAAAATSSNSPLLKYKQQRGVTCMAWKPFYASELAVGCSSGLLIWTIDPSSVVARPSAGCVSLLQYPGHSPVSGMEWQPSGELLLTCSAADSSIILWNTASEIKTPLKRAGGGFHLVAWAPNGKNVFAASTRSMFRVWETRRWTQQKWNVFGGCVRAACWSADSTTLLYATATDSKIFCIRFQPNVMASDEEDFQSVGSAVTVMDLDPVAFANDVVGKEVVAGGLVQSMRWDSTGERLAVSFVESNLLAVFQTEVTFSSVSLCPIGFVNGEVGGEHPSCFEFAKHFDEGSLLTIAWSSGRLQHFPMFFTSKKAEFFPQQCPTTGQHGTVRHQGMSHQLSTSHLLNNSLNALAEFEPQIFSSPAV